MDVAEPIVSRRLTSLTRTWFNEPHAPTTGAVVMGTGIVSVDLAFSGQRVLSAVPLAIAVAVWFALAVQLLVIVVRAPARLVREARSPASLTGVAGSAVIGVHVVLFGWAWLGTVMLLMTVVFAAALAYPVAAHWRTPTVGVSFLATVAFMAVATLAALCARALPVTWLTWPGLVCWILGALLYGVIFGRFDVSQLVRGAGDHWVVGGALAIRTLAWAKSHAGVGSIACPRRNGWRHHHPVAGGSVLGAAIAHRRVHRASARVQHRALGDAVSGGHVCRLQLCRRHGAADRLDAHCRRRHHLGGVRSMAPPAPAGLRTVKQRSTLPAADAQSRDAHVRTGQ